jgi:hypothetical protein
MRDLSVKTGDYGVRFPPEGITDGLGHLPSFTRD